MANEPRPNRRRPGQTEEDQMANWGWGLGLLVPPFGLVLGILLTRRGDRRGPLIMIWSLVVPVVVALILVLG